MKPNIAGGKACLPLPLQSPHRTTSMILKKQKNVQRAFGYVRTLNQVRKKWVKENQKYHNMDFSPLHTVDIKPTYNKNKSFHS